MVDLYYFHSSDHPGSTLVTKQLNRDSYAIWSRVISITISAKNKNGFVDGLI